MLKRRSLLAQIITLAAAPAIIRVAPLMRVKPGLAHPGYCSLDEFETTMDGVVIAPLYRVADVHGCCLLARNMTTAPLRFGGIVLRAGEERVLSKLLRPPSIRIIWKA